MTLKRSSRVCVQGSRSPHDGKLPFIMGGITAAEENRLQRMANNLERRLFRRRVIERDKLLSELRSALLREGMVRVCADWLGTDFVFRAELGWKLKALLRSCKRLRRDDVLYGHVTRAARRCGLDSRIEDIGTWRRGNRVEGLVRPVPFTVVRIALDRILDDGKRRGKDRSRRCAAPRATRA